MDIPRFILYSSFLGFLIYLGVKSYENTPVVYWSVSRQACEKIIKDGKDLSCSELESIKRYEKIYAK